METIERINQENIRLHEEMKDIRLNYVNNREEEVYSKILFRKNLKMKIDYSNDRLTSFVIN